LTHATDSKWHAFGQLFGGNGGFMAKPRQSVQKRIREEKKRDRERRKREKATLKAERREGKDSGGSESEQDDPGQVDPSLQTG